jgi:molecular chaperone GrpE (heat shock protein)
VYNKIDVTRQDLPLKWMKDFDAFQRALDNDDTYAASLSKSLSLVLDEFYETLTAVGVSSVTGEGMDKLFQVLLPGASSHVPAARAHSLHVASILQFYKWQSPPPALGALLFLAVFAILVCFSSSQERFL